MKFYELKLKTILRSVDNETLFQFSKVLLITTNEIKL